MAKVTQSEMEKYKSEQKAKTHEELHLIVPKDVAAAFRQVAKAANTSTDALFEEMVAAHSEGMNLRSKS